MQWYPAACPVCRGDLHDALEDEGWLTCFSCARSFAPSDPRLPEAVKLETQAKASPATSKSHAA
jgi:hypothetical protein